MKKSSIVIGVHGGHANVGAVGAIGLISESSTSHKLAKMVVRELQKEGYQVVNNSVRFAHTPQECLNKLLQRHKDNHCTHELSIHFNAFNGGAMGCELFTNFAPIKAKRFLSQYSSETLFINRGIKDGSNLFVINHFKNAMLLEVCFCDNKSDVKKLQAITLKNLAHIIAKNYIETILKEGD